MEKKSGGLFDFNRDGEVSFGEKAFGIAALLALAAELESEKVKIEISTEEDELDRMERAELEARLEKLRDRRCALDDEEPDDPDSDAYDAWEERCEALDDQLDELEALYDPEEWELYLYAASGTGYVVRRVVRANADSALEALASAGWCDLTEFEASEEK